MIEETVQVMRREGDYIWFEAQPRSACGECSVSKGCGTGALSKVLGRRAVEMRALNTVGAEPGDRVVIGIAESALVRGSMAVYLVPLLVMLAGGILGENLAPQLGWSSVDVASVVFGAVGLLVGFMWARIFSGKAARDTRYHPVTLKRLVGSTAPLVFVGGRDKTSG